jgi:hypothetical protein
MNMHQQVELEDNFLIQLVSSDKPIFFTGDKITIMCTCRDDKVQLLSSDINLTMKKLMCFTT